MSWLWLSLLAPALLTVVAFVDKYVITRRVKASASMAMYSSVTAAVFGSAIWVLTGRPELAARNGWLILAAGFISLFGTMLYFYGLSQSRTSYVVALLQLEPIFTLLLATIFLGEKLSAMQLAGFVIVLVAVLGLSVEKGSRKLTLGKPFYAVLLSDLLFAVASIIVKYTSNLHSFVPILAYESWGLALAGVVVFAVWRPMRQAFVRNVRSVGGQTLGVIFGNEALYVVTKAVTFLAITLGPVALVSVLAGTQVFYGLLFGVILAVLLPGLFGEELSGKSMPRSIFFSILLFLGIAFTYF